MNRLLSFFLITLFPAFIVTCPDSTGPDENGTGETIYNVSINIKPADGGTGSPSLDSTYTEGKQIQLLASASDGYVFTHWSGDIDSTAGNPLDLIVDQDYNLEAHFEPKTYELTTATEGEGTVSETLVKRQAKEYEHGAVVELMASPAEGYKFAEWKGDLTGTENSAQITVDRPKAVTAVFSQFYQASNGVTVKCPSASPGDTGTVNGVSYTKRSVDQITPENAATTCTSGITDMNGLFGYVDSFNKDISHWDVSSVTNMKQLFFYAESFNQDLSGWDVSSVTDMSQMFSSAIAFNGDISSWNVSSVVDMNSMFSSAKAFNQSIGGWDVSSVTDMRGMFYATEAFNQDISGWDVSKVTDMVSMFRHANAFNQDIGSWDVINVTNMNYMFSDNVTFNQNLGAWDVSKVMHMSYMFRYATAFNQDLSSWCVSTDRDYIDFANGAGFDPNDGTNDTIDADKQPQWGEPCPSN